VPWPNTTETEKVVEEKGMVSALKISRRYLEVWTGDEGKQCQLNDSSSTPLLKKYLK
jgi:hypothetical protein